MSFSIPLMKEPVSAVDTAKFFPQLVFGTLMPLGILLIIRGLIRDKKKGKCGGCSGCSGCSGCVMAGSCGSCSSPKK